MEELLTRIAVALERIADDLERRPKKKRQPQMLSVPECNSVDDWLQWRLTEKQNGHRVTLEELSLYSGYSIDILKKRSSKFK